MTIGMDSYFQQGVGGVVQTEDEGSHTHHVVDVGESDERNADQVVHKHHQEVLGRERGNKGQAVQTNQHVVPGVLTCAPISA